ncbi:hypothetical protein [Thermospira aquatica]|uniref:Uncharacterized protein n=1 Tax=Thermospira aquatica TaxID=2828656 RepID=A0AAX3BFC6_9SPIR|nr:hypothetical protein [Thermospira aquatica]URA10764.1 hypothetical protein KDW03_02880 [Thermospira aquatica]
MKGDLFTGNGERVSKASKRKNGDTGLFCEDNRPKNRNYAARLLRQHGKTIYVGKKNYLKADIAKKNKRPGRKKNSAKRN